MLNDPTTLIQIQCSLKAFIDNVVLHATVLHKAPLHDLQNQAQEKICWWNQLVKVTGGELNPLKCCGLLYTWEPDQCRILQLKQPDPPAMFISLEPGIAQPTIAINKNHEGTHYLGLYITADQNTKPMENHLWKKALTYTTAFHRTLMSHCEAGVLYWSCFILSPIHYRQLGYLTLSLKKCMAY